MGKYLAALVRKAGPALPVLAGFLLLVARVNAQKIKVDFDRDFDFSKIHNYEWRVHPIFEKNPELSDRYSTAIHLVMNESNKQLMKKGYRPVSSTPDVLLTFFVTAQDVKQTFSELMDPFGTGYGWYGWYAPPVWVTRTEQYLHGTLLMDIIDPKGFGLLWRASATDEISDFRNRDKNVDSAVKKMFKKFPPKPKKAE